MFFLREKHRCWEIVYCAGSPNPYICNLSGRVIRGFYGISKRKDGYYQHVVVVQMPCKCTDEEVARYVSHYTGEKLFDWMALPIGEFDGYLQFAREKGYVDGEF